MRRSPSAITRSGRGCRPSNGCCARRYRSATTFQLCPRETRPTNRAAHGQAADHAAAAAAGQGASQTANSPSGAGDLRARHRSRKAGRPAMPRQPLRRQRRRALGRSIAGRCSPVFSAALVQPVFFVHAAWQAFWRQPARMMGPSWIRGPTIGRGSRCATAIDSIPTSIAVPDGGPVAGCHARDSDSSR